MKIVSLKRLGNIENELIEKYPDISFSFYDKADNIPDNDKKELEILIGYDGEINERFIKSCPNLKWIAWYATGVNNLPLEYIKNKGIILTNTRGIQSKQLSEYILTFILDDHKKMKTSFINQQNRIYDSKMTGRRLNGDCILFLGTGAIAQRTAKLAKAFDMKVIGVSKSGEHKEWFDEVQTIDNLSDLLGKGDIVINSLPETDETIHLIKYKDFENMKESAMFINVGRGTVVEEDTLIKALSNNEIRHAYLDVFEKEPLTSDNALYDLDNVTITAHITGNDHGINHDVTEIFIKNLKHFLNYGNLIENEVDPVKGY